MLFFFKQNYYLPQQLLKFKKFNRITHVIKIWTKKTTTQNSAFSLSSCSPAAKLLRLIVKCKSYRSFMAICSNMAEPVLAFQFPDIDFLLRRDRGREIWEGLGDQKKTQPNLKSTASAPTLAGVFCLLCSLPHGAARQH